MLNTYMYNLTNNDHARRIDFGPIELEQHALTKLQKQKILNMEHVISFEETNRWGRKLCTFSSDNKNVELKRLKQLGVDVISAYKTEEIDTLGGEQLSNSGIYTCLVPNYFYPDLNVDTLNDNIEFLDGKAFIGETLHLETTKYSIPVEEYSMVDVPLTEFTLKVVGVYDVKKTVLDSGCILVSYDTGVALDRLCMEQVRKNNPLGYKAVVEQRQSDSNKYYSILVDDYNNIQEVILKLEEIGISDCGPGVIIMDSFKLLANVVNVAGKAFTFAILGLAVLNIFLAVHNAMTERTKEIGLLKAIGYRDRQVFLSMYLEQLKIGLVSFFIAAALSFAVIAIYNWSARNGSYDSMLKTVSWPPVTALAAAALAIAVLVPLLCQLFTLRRLVKIPPGEAMKL